MGQEITILIGESLWAFHSDITEGIRTKRILVDAAINVEQKGVEEGRASRTEQQARRGLGTPEDVDYAASQL